MSTATDTPNRAERFLGRLRKIIGKRRRVEFVDQPYAVG